MNFLDKSAPDSTSGGRSITISDDGSDFGIRIAEWVGVYIAGRYHHLTHDFWIHPDDLVEVHAALGRAIDARLHAEASKSVNPKE